MLLGTRERRLQGELLVSIQSMHAGGALVAGQDDKLILKFAGLHFFNPVPVMVRLASFH